MKKENKYYYVVECVKLKKENNHLVIDYGYPESVELFDSLKKAKKYYEKVSYYANEKLGCLLVKVSPKETDETLNNWTYEIDDKVYYVVDELKSTF